MIVKQLNTPVKRLGFIVLIVGAVLLAIGLHDIGNHRYTFDRWWGSVMFEGYDYRRSPLAAWGTYMTIVGLLMSFLYDVTIGRVVRWIRMGSPESSK